MDERVREILERIEREKERGYVSRYIANLISEKERLTELSERDELTGAYNKRKFAEDLENEIRRADREKQNVSLASIDIDNFKQVNDRYGHLEGDRVLTEVVESLGSDDLRSHERKVYRVGGDEFTMIFPNTSRKGGVMVGERLRKSVEEKVGKRLRESPEDPSVTISIGVANYRENTSKLGELLRRADEALYEAKTSGRNRVV